MHIPIIQTDKITLFPYPANTQLKMQTKNIKQMQSIDKLLSTYFSMLLIGLACICIS